MFGRIISIPSTRYKAEPEQQSLNGCLRVLKYKLSQAVCIGNSTEDAIYAKNAGVDFIYLEREEHELRSKKLKPIQSQNEFFYTNLLQIYICLEQITSSLQECKKLEV